MSYAAKLSIFPTFTCAAAGCCTQVLFLRPLTLNSFPYLPSIIGVACNNTEVGG